ncbi:TAT-variant-translocated molybdopterin oxidoreductase [candidate division KSB1 bacterium]|nr:TAT-variant-translocated molybdopterin oxidoreductase [candidate division KSB1 bacterium]
MKLKGKEYWRSLDQLAGTPEFKEFLHREFPVGASEMLDNTTRRKFLGLMGASLALAGLSGCRRPVEKVIPYVIPPEEIVPGIPQYYSTTMPFGSNSYGLIVKSHEGRPTKCEGNDDHPSSYGKSNTFIQGAMLGLYDPDRSQHILQDGLERSWNDFASFWSGLRQGFAANGGSGLAVISESFNSPTLARLTQEFKTAFPQAMWATYEPVSDENIFEGIRAATNGNYIPVYHFENADIILSLDSDFLLSESENIANTKRFTDRRRISSETESMSRLYIVESGFSITGGMADHRMRLQSRQVGAFAVRVAQALGEQGVQVEGINNIQVSGGDNFDRQWINAVAGDLVQAQGRSIVVAGRNQPPAVHALVASINAALGNAGATITYHQNPNTSHSNGGELANLAGAIRNGNINTLVILGGNPVYNAPADMDFGSLLSGVENTVHLSGYVDETSREADWHIPQSHFLESWGDAGSADGTLGIIQPLISPLFDSYTNVHVLDLLANNSGQNDYEIVRRTWRPILGNGNFERNWRRVLHDGLLPGSSSPPASPGINNSSLSAVLSAHRFDGGAVSASNLEIVFQPSNATYDGRYANNGWLQEFSDPVTKIVWDNPVLISPATARELDLENNDMVNISFDGRELEMPVWIQPGHADNTISVTLGYGRESIGRVADGVGFNTYLLRSSSGLNFGDGASLRKTNGSYRISATQDHHSMEGRPIVREATVEEYREEPHFAEEMVEHPPLKSMWQEFDYSKGYQWGMSIDLNTCTGCNACNIACQSENNIPIVGKEQVYKGREMHWIRIDRYYTGDPENPEMVHQPLLCQQCENAPCEQVCPVAATMHSKEGLNQMVYNRCIGTRYCSNNCPYKVRRFNFFNYTKDTPEIVKMAQNPEVTVRSRGVMEKCTYCVQRINVAKIKANVEDRQLQDGEIKTACQQTCPADAIVFGDINDPDSRVSQAKKQNRDYVLLAELNNKPRTSFLAKIRNPNPALG